MNCIERGVIDLTKASSIPTSNGSRYYKPFKTKIAIIADKDLFDFYENSAQITDITPSNWQTLLGKVDVLLITNAKQGLNGEWWGVENPKCEKRVLLSQLIENYRVHGAKVVFYTKENNGDYQAFLDIAKLCDYIFTASVKRVADYQAICGHDRVYKLGFGVNPTHYNPIGFKKFPKISGAVFSGVWNERFTEKAEDAEMIFDGIVEANHELSIIENYYALQNANYFFADRYFENISDIEKEDLQVAHKLFNWAVNINSSNHNNSMFADYVYALQASGNIVLSNYNEGINNLFPHVFTIVKKEEIGGIMSTFDEEELYEHQILGIRKIMTHDTSYQRMYELLKKIGMDVQDPIRRVAVIVKEDSAKVREQFLEQSYPHKKIVLEEKISDDLLKEYDFITYFNSQANYNAYYLEDMINAFKYTDVDFVTKAAYFQTGELQVGVEHDYVANYEDKARTVFSTENYTTLAELDNQTGIGYAIDHFEFNMGTSDKIVATEQDYKLSVIIPVYNNGECLHSKAFNSLRRCSMFQVLEIIIVDDGSTDTDTVSMIKRIAKKYRNVKTYFYPKGGSGSAARPRNKGVWMSTTTYITYLDPDDEMINDGFTTLYKEITSGDYSMIIGNAMMITQTNVRHVDYYKLARKANDDMDIITDSRAFLLAMDLKPMHLMAMIVKKEIILTDHLMMIEGAFGEDTLFYHELVLNAKRIKLIDEPIFLYYRTIETSATNKISATLFERYLLREKAAQKKYANYGILQEYLTRRYERFFKTWYFSKLRKVEESEWIAVINILKEMIDLHASYYILKDEDMIRFYDLAMQEDYDALSEAYVYNGFTTDHISSGKEVSKEELGDSFNSRVAEEKSNPRQQAQAFKEKISKSFLLEVKAKITELPTCNGSRYYAPFNVKIAIIADEYIYEHCKNSATFIYVTPHNYKDYVGKIDVFLITNVHTGLDSEWVDMANPKSTQRSALTKMINEYREAGAKIVYCATREPPDGKMLEGVAKKCDYVFTTSVEKIASYKERCKTDQVHVLKWGVNPLIHNPIGCRRFMKYPSVIFSRSCLDAFPKMTKEIRKPFDGVIVSDYGLIIVKQNFNVMKQNLEMKNSQDFFPQRYWAYLLEAVEQESLPNMHKLYDWAININRSDSQTIANGLYELQAMGNLVLSNDNSGINSPFPNVFTIEEESQVIDIMTKFSDVELYQKKMLGVRNVMSRETIYHHFCDLLCKIGMDVALPIRKVAVVVQKDSEIVREMYRLQSYQEKELLLAKDLSDEVLEKYEFIAFFDEEASYGVHYLEDMVNAFKYTDVDFVTKQAYLLNGQLVAGVEHDYVDSYGDKARTVFSTRNYRLVSELDGFMGLGYAVDRFEFEVNRDATFGD